MRRSAVATPCPVPSPLDHFQKDYLDETTTTAIDFTTELRASFQNAKPRRRGAHPVRFTIHEDLSQDAAPDYSRTSILQPPTKRHPLRGDQASAVEKGRSPVFARDDTGAMLLPSMGSVLGQAPRRPAIRVSSRVDNSSKKATSEPQSQSTQNMRPARRGTLFIPNDDTTMPSMYMGIFSPIKDLDVKSGAVGQPDFSMELTGIAAQMAEKRKPRKSIIAYAARRGILRDGLRPIQEIAQQQDIHGQGDGKENVPPGCTERKRDTGYQSLKVTTQFSAKKDALCLPPSRVDRQKPCAATASSLQKRDSLRVAAPRQPALRPAWNGGARLKQASSVTVPYKIRQPISPPSMLASTCKPPVPTRFVMPVIQPETTCQTYGVLQEDITDPTIYEEDWLLHQEAAISQLVNRLFSNSQSEDNVDHQTFRSKLLELHCSASMTLMHKRLHAALMYGSLSIPQDTLGEGARLQNDIGLRRDFTDLWLCSYDRTVLQSALEIVVGRACRSSTLRISEAMASTSKTSKSVLRNFIESFLIRNEDANPELGVRNRTAWSYQRTILRSLLLVKVLDLAKTEESLGMSRNLFQHRSTLKDSTSVIHALIQMLNPAAGDPIRALAHIDYHVSHVQHPLAEFDYLIGNIAIDFRDGVRLTRLVELLLYPSTSKALDRQFDGGTTTVLMPEGESLEFEEGQGWPLSQHIKTPYHSRVVRLWNVQLALSALENVKSMSTIIHGITAADIVDGHREKTIKLLWGLVNRWGLSGLINWQDLRWEVQRLEDLTGVSRNNEFEDAFDAGQYPFEFCNSLLKRWARALAQSKNLKIQNFTTSFADGKIFEAIVDEYEPHLISENTQSASTFSLKNRLARLGCSSEFSALFAESKQAHIFSRDFVLAVLAFLCSRLLAPSQRSRAATVIQRAWRQHWSRTESLRKVEKRKLALACAEYVSSKHNHSINPDATNINNLNRPITSTIEHSHNPLSPSSSDIWLNL